MNICAYTFVDKSVKKEIRKTIEREEELADAMETGDQCLPLWSDIEKLPQVNVLPYNFIKKHLVKLNPKVVDDQNNQKTLQIQLPSDKMFDDEFLLIPEHILRSQQFLRYLKQQHVHHPETQETEGDEKMQDTLEIDEDGEESEDVSSGSDNDNSDDIRDYLSEYEDFHMMDADSQTDDEVCQYLPKSKDSANAVSSEKEEPDSKQKERLKKKKDKKKHKKSKKKTEQLLRVKDEDEDIPVQNGRFEIEDLQEFQHHIKVNYGMNCPRQFDSLKDLEKKFLRQMNALHRDVVHGPQQDSMKTRKKSRSDAFAPRYEINNHSLNFVKVFCNDPRCNFELRFRKFFKNGGHDDEHIDYIKFDISVRKFHTAPFH